MNSKKTLILPVTLLASATAVAKAPNIVYILADDLGYGDLTCYNADGKLNTVHLDAMAKNGVMFSDAHTSSAVSTPTRYGVVTGRYNWRSSMKRGVLSGYSKSLIAPDRRTVADVLKDSGYTTAVVGKWHLGWGWDITAPDAQGRDIDNLSSRPEVDFTAEVTESPNDHGFDYFYCFCGSLDMAPYVWVENNKVVEQPTKTTRNSGMKFWRPGLTAEGFVHEKILQEVADKSMEIIAEQSKSKDPFFIYMPLPAPHSPILPSDEFLGKSNTNTYGDYVLQVDDLVGQIRRALDEAGVSDNTILIFTSDNGCSTKANLPELKSMGHLANGILRGNKADLYEGGHRVPFVVEWPKGAGKDKVCDDIICTTDLFATAAEITGYKIADSEGEDSYSFLPSLKGKKNSAGRESVIHHSVSGAFSIRKGDWKMLFSAGSAGWSFPTDGQIKKQKLDLPKYQLYNLKDDISETTNLYGKHPEVEAELIAALQEIIKNGRSTPGAPQANDQGTKGWPQADEILAL